jgi:predicted signal transduction protein with EAL and GGDEF domain
LSGIGRDKLKTILKAKFEHYTESEYLSLINRLFQGDYRSEKEHDDIVENIVKTSEHPNEIDILYYPEEGVEDSAAGVLKAIKEWRAANGKPGFKPE